VTSSSDSGNRKGNSHKLMAEDLGVQSEGFEEQHKT
jgi:hypothetical protein